MILRNIGKEFGEGEEVLGIFAHMDVVPAGSGWDTDPYTPTIKDGRLYARGASDDKGPTMRIDKTCWFCSDFLAC